MLCIPCRCTSRGRTKSAGSRDGILECSLVEQGHGDVGDKRDAVCQGQACQRGKFGKSGQISSAAAACDVCLSGMYTQATGQTTCAGIECDAGYYGEDGQTSESSAKCKQCSRGQFQPLKGQKSCTTNNCQPGKYLASEPDKPEICDPCGSGQFEDDAGKTACKDVS